MNILVANESHFKYAQAISDTITESAKVRGTGIARRTPEYIIERLKNGNAVIALDDEKFAGFCYIEVWGNKDFVANSFGKAAKPVKTLIFSREQNAKCVCAQVCCMTQNLKKIKKKKKAATRSSND